MAEHYETCLLGQKKWSVAKALLVAKKETVGSPLCNEAIQSSAADRHGRFFNDVKNLFLGGSSENRSLGRRLDKGKPGQSAAALKAHIAYVKRKWALDGSFTVTV
jgi:hypothetical protein